MNTYKFSVSIFYLLLVVCFFGCDKKQLTRLEFALNTAGENKIELQRVLNHYSVNPKDSLKYKAACFLIENMTYHKSLISCDLSTYIEKAKHLTLKIQENKSDMSNYRAATIAHDSLKKIYGLGFSLRYISQYDIHEIKANFLIENIDLSFQIWETVPWGKFVSFEQLCHDILPYRVFDESITNWRKVYFDQFKNIQDSVSKNATLIQVSKVLYNEIVNEVWHHVDNLGTADLDAITMVKYRYGSCKEKAAFLLYAMRSLCIPGSIDMYLQAPNKINPFHYWNQMKNSKGNPIEFLINDLCPDENSCDTTRKKGVIYRLNYSEQGNSLPLKFKNRDMPNNLTNIYLSDISHEYFPASKISIHIDKNEHKNEILYLCLFNNTDWRAVAFSDIKNSESVFKGLEPDIVYLPAFYKKGTLVYADSPFLLTVGNKIHYFHPDTINTQTVLLERKHPLPTELDKLKSFLLGGRFEGANNADFSDAQILHIITNANDFKKTSISVDSFKKYRFMRYISSVNGRCNMAELAFRSADDIILKGTIIGTDGSCNYNSQRKKEAAFDGNPLTFFESHLLSDAWVGLDFGTPYPIKEIIYQFRNDDNLIRENDIYELFYFTVRGPVSLGKQIGTDNQILIFDNVPKNALLWLRNYTRGKEERIFTYENDRQIWW